LEVKEKLTTNYTPKYNDASKRDNWIIVEAARSMLHANNIHITFGGKL
jgi:hypothetical protein